MRFDVITLFPEMFEAINASGVSSRALQQGLYSFNGWNPRQFTTDVHQTVDDRPYGGGPGMLMKYQPLKDSVDAIKASIGVKPYVVYLSPQGTPLTQAKLEALVEKPNLTLVCGRYEGVDERFIHAEVDEEICVGDFVVSGGELPAMMLMDGLIRLLPGALGHSQSAEQDSFSDGLLDCPHYTRPVEVDGMKVPEVLQQGNHAKIDAWRMAQKLERTAQKRPDLYATYLLKQQDNR
ncbi:tRNA (guanosine(37)-N1)-methyltransferase TrmD [Hydrogenovibrio kuenenii]|uniref:tRNA (guanosine(37)-N1)-methyltransferase TrmD n=1 Tax=Hydrogenovibrio kuenenii TaxID=63658 RepID=UPI000464CE6E|nr:tRNA (guanosine(37)-N1)-methyltransferase TrmD [Hydrogenovibrio kuenenii]